ncbi:hypothetical protein ES707_22117 [subsurface metagenome]
MKKEKRKEWIAILDFSSQYTQLIARRIREAKVYSEIFPYYINLEKIRQYPPKGFILSGEQQAYMRVKHQFAIKKYLN